MTGANVKLAKLAVWVAGAAATAWMIGEFGAAETKTGSAEPVTGAAEPAAGAVVADAAPLTGRAEIQRVPILRWESDDNDGEHDDDDDDDEEDADEEEEHGRTGDFRVRPGSGSPAGTSAAPALPRVRTRRS